MFDARIQFMLNYRSEDDYEADWLVRTCRLSSVLPNGMEIHVKNNIFKVVHTYIDLDRTLMVVSCESVFRSSETGDTWENLLEYYNELGFYLL